MQQNSNITEALIDRGLLIELLNKCGTPLFVKNRQHQMLLVNDSLCELVGLSQSEMIGKTDFDLYSEDEAEEFFASDEQVFQSKVELEYEEVITDTNENSRNIRTIKNVYTTENGDEFLVGTLHDITELRQAQTQLEAAVNDLSVIATTDSLTGLCNRAELEYQMESLIEEANISGEGFGLIFLDLNGFKIINDTAGHMVGDGILRLCSEKLVNMFSQEALIARVGGDEFIVVLPRVNEIEAQLAVERLFQALDKSIVVDESAWRVGCSVGVALFPKDGQTVSDLIRNADFAMYEAKKRKHNRAGSNKSTAEFFQSQIGYALARKRRIECALNFRENFSQIQQYYQPIVSQVDGKYRITGFESLARWELDGVSVSPEEFIPILEKGGLIIPFGYQVVESACRYMAERCDEGQFISVNLTYQQILQEGFCDQVHSIIQNAGINPRQISLELTENDANLDCRIAEVVLAQLSRIGVKTMLDDFGSGFSNLSRLSELPIQVVKIDKSLLWGDRLLFKSVLQMIQNLGFTTIVEGVESAEQLLSVEQFGADMLQGYFFGKPQPEDYDWSNFSPETVEKPLPFPANLEEFRARLSSPDSGNSPAF